MIEGRKREDKRREVGKVMRNFAILLFIFPVILLILNGCGSGIISTFYHLNSNIMDGSAVPPNSYIIISIKNGNGEIIPSTVELYKDGNLLGNFGPNEEHHLLVEDEGKYMAKVKVENVKYEAELNFKVTKLEREIYLDGGRFYVDYSPGEIARYSSSVVFVRFYKQDSIDITSTETVQKRIRLRLVDTDGDGVFDLWQEVQTPQEQGWIEIPITINYQDYDWKLHAFEYSEDWIYTIYTTDIGGIKYFLLSKLASVGFNLNVYYARYVANDQIENSCYYYDSFILHERYDTDNKPIFKLVKTGNTNEELQPSDEFTINVAADNVREYANLYDVRFMKIAVKYSKGLILTGVDFGNFMEGMTDFHSYKGGATSVILYRGFVYGDDEDEQLTANFAVLHFKVATDATPDSEYKVELVYEPWFDTYGGYPDYPNPLFKDESNSFVDGFIIDHEPVVISVGGGS